MELSKQALLVFSIILHAKASLFGVSSHPGSVNLYPDETINVYMMTSPISIAMDFLRLKTYVRDIDSNIKSALEQFVTQKIRPGISQSLLEKCLFSVVSTSDNPGCTSVKQGQFITEKMQPYLDWLKQYDAEIQIRLSKMESILPQVYWPAHSKQLIRIHPYTANIFNISAIPPFSEQGISTSVSTITTSSTVNSVTTTSITIENKKSDQPNSGSQVIQDQPDLIINVIPFQDSSLARFTYPEDNYYINAFTFQLVKGMAEVTIAQQGNDVLLDTTDFFIKSPKIRFQTLANTNRTIHSLIQDTWTKSLDSLEDFLKDPIFEKLETLKTLLNIIMNTLTQQINIYQSLEVIPPVDTNTMLKTVLLDIEEILNLARPHLQHFQGLVPAMAQALAKPNLHMSLVPHCFGEYPALHFNTVGYYPATVIQIDPFILKELNQPFVLTYFPPGISIIWTTDGVSYYAKAEVPHYDLRMQRPIHQEDFQEISIISTPVQIVEQRILQCIATITDGDTAAAIQLCNFTVAAPYVNNWHMQRNLLVFELQMEIPVTMVCHCQSAFHWFKLDLLGSGTLEVPEYCQVHHGSEQHIPSRTMPVPRTQNPDPCTAQQLLDTIIYDRTLPRVTDLAKFILRNHLIQKENIPFAIKQLNNISSLVSDNTLLQQAIKLLTDIQPNTTHSTISDLKKWFNNPSNIVTTSLTCITLIVWVGLIFRCHRHRCDRNPADCKEETEMIRRSVRSAYTIMETDNLMSEKSTD